MIIKNRILRLAVPSLFANITIPLVGVVDLAIAGHISDASVMGGIAVGTMLFDLLYWNFGFLRAGSGGLTAQAYGRGDSQGISDIFTQSIVIALGGALLLVLIGWIFVDLVMACMPHTPEVEDFARHYYNVRIWAAPATLSLMVFKGWYIGCQNTVAPMICDITVNAVNMVASYFLAVHTHLGAIGVAYGTLIAQYVGLGTACFIFILRYKHFLCLIDLRASMCWLKLRRLVSLNGQFFLRSLGFMAVYVGFTILLSNYGDVPLAVGAIMMNLFMIFSYFIDGFAYAGEALVGKNIGEGNRADADTNVKHLLYWTLGIGIVFTVIFWVFDSDIVRLMTSDHEVISGARPFLPWLVAMPLLSCAAFLWDGVYIGAAAGRQVRDCMLLAALAFIIGYLAFAKVAGAQAVYIGYFLHLAIRTGYLSIKWPKVINSAFSGTQHAS